MVVADSRQFPWIAMEFAVVMDPQTERLIRYLAHLTDMGVLNCPNPILAAHQLMGALNEFSLWPWMMGRPPLVSLERGTRGHDPDVPPTLSASMTRSSDHLLPRI